MDGTVRPDGFVVDGLSVTYRTARGRLQVLRDVSLRIGEGEALGLVGESGSGKSTLAYAGVRYLSPNASVPAGAIRIAGEDVLALSESRLRALRGGDVGMVYQDPSTALNPTLRLGAQLIEGLAEHEGLDAEAARARALDLLATVRLPDPAFIMRRFPHEVSGGEKQRVLIAMALACRPRLLIFDEPTTALDATTAAGIVDLIGRLRSETGITVLYITHDLGTVARVADRLAVIYAGTIVETGPTAEVMGRPRHPYTRMLVASVPNPFRGDPRRRLVSFTGDPPDLHAPPGGCILQARCPFVQDRCRSGRIVLPDGTGHRSACIREAEIRDAALPRPPAAAVRAEGEPDAPPLIEVEGLSVRFGRRGLMDQILGRPGEAVHAVSGVSLSLGAGETFGLVGESGCGKSSLARALVGLNPFEGEIRLGGETLSGVDRMTRAYRKAVQIVFQHPDLSLNPRMTVGEIVGRPIRLYEGIGGAALAERVAGLLDQVRLPRTYAERHPHQLSGGEKQRVAIARAFGPHPRLVICDEITSGLDVSVQASILNLLADLQDEHGTTYLFISHDLNLVQHVADRVGVMYLGRMVELRDVTGPLAAPFHPYTEALLSAVPVPEPSLVARRIRLEGALPSPKSPPPGCAFHTRCPRRIGLICDETRPTLTTRGADHRIACHIDDATLAAVPPILSRIEP